MFFLLPPSEGKQVGGRSGSLSNFSYALPYQIAVQASEKDLKCKGSRYTEAHLLNQQAKKSNELLPAIERYSGVMFKAINYPQLSASSQQYFDNHVLIISGMWGLLAPRNMIPNYKLPIDTKGLKQFWGETITQQLIVSAQQNNYHQIVDLLPEAYQKVIDYDQLVTHGLAVTQVSFYDLDSSKKLTHGVKKIKGERLQQAVTQQVQTIEQLKHITHPATMLVYEKIMR